ncbi:MAG: small subunit ribosomal protein S6 [Rhodothermales bacterium]|jgi:small subunit ribosomal protein S6
MAIAKNTYELSYIVNSVLSEDQIKDLVERVTVYIKEGGSDILDVDVWGSRRLAYPIQKKRNGFYVNMYFNASGSFIGRLERALEIDDNILRYLTLKMDGKMIRHFEVQKAQRSTPETPAAETTEDNG